MSNNGLKLFKNFVPCQKNIFELLNSNFFKIGSMWQLSVKGIVEELPSSSEVGDIYIIEEDSHYFFKLFSGNNWISIQVEDGNIFWNEESAAFEYFEDGYFSKLSGVGVVQVPTVLALNDIPAQDRIEGMLAYVVATRETYQLQGGITNAYWSRVLRQYSGNTVYIQGDAVTNNSWRLRVDGFDNSLSIEKREAGSWNIKTRLP